MKAEISKVIPNPVDKTVQLDIQMAIGPGKIIVESFAGVGSTAEEAENDAMQNFVRSSFHPLISAFVSPDEQDEHAVRSEKLIGGVLRKLTSSDVVIRGTIPADRQKLMKWFGQFEAHLAFELLSLEHIGFGFISDRWRAKSWHVKLCWIIRSGLPCNLQCRKRTGFALKSFMASGIS